MSTLHHIAATTGPVKRKVINCPGRPVLWCFIGMVVGAISVAIGYMGPW